MGEVVMGGQDSLTAVPPGREPIGKWVWAFLKPTITAGAVLTFCAGAMVLTYLRKIDRIDLLQRALASKDGLVLVFAFALVLSATLFICLFASALITHAGVGIYKSHTDISPSIPAYLTGVQMTGALVMFLLFYSGGEVGHTHAPFIWISQHYNSIMIGFIVVVAVFGGALQAKFPIDAANPELTSKERFSRLSKKFSPGAFIGLMFSTGVLFTAFAAWAFFVMNPAIGKQKVDFLSSVMAVLTAVPGMLISNYLLRSYCKYGDMKKSQRESVIGSILVGAFVCMTIPQLTLYPIDMHALSAAGMYSTDKSSYVVKSQEEKEALKLAGFTLNSPDNNAVYIDAYVRFHFGNLLVLCTDPYDPLALSGFTDTKVPVGVQQQSEKEHLKGGCLDTDPEKVARITLGLLSATPNSASQNKVAIH